MRRVRDWCAVFLFLGCSSCSDDALPEDDEPQRIEIPTEGPVSSEDLPPALSQVICERIVECGCSLAELPLCTENGLCFSDADDCITKVAPSMRALVRSNSSLQAYDPDGGRICLDAALETTCESVLWQDQCAHVISGAAQLGEACGTSEDCAGHATGDAICGSDDVCTPPRAMGETAGLGESCGRTCHQERGCVTYVGSESSAACQVEEGLTCGASACVPVLTEGDSCLDEFECADGLYCDITCQAQLSAGDACPNEVPFPCATGLFCSAGTCSAQLAIGQPCVTNADCSSMNCAANGYCAHEGTLPVCAL